MNVPLVATVTPLHTWPFVVLAVSVAFIVVAITRLRMHAFLALILAAFLTGFLADGFSEASLARLPAALRDEAQANSWVAAMELTAVEFGGAAGAIAISIGLASIIGLCVMESGGADKVVRRFLAVFGEKRAGWALLASTYVLSIPIFFDTMFMLMVPLARALRLRTGKSYLLYLLVVASAAMITHSLTVPHPGPLAMVENLRVDPGFSLVWSIVAGVPPCLIGYFVARWLDRRDEVPLRETPGATMADLEAIVHKPERELPSFAASIAPVLLPILLIGFGSFWKVFSAYPQVVTLFGGADHIALATKVIAFAGNKNFALSLGAAIAIVVLARQRRMSLQTVGELLEPPIATAGVIVLITAAGGAFGGMLRHAGVGDAVKSLAESYQLNLVVLAWVTALVIRIAQGSATVAMITASAVMWPMIDPAANAPLAFHPMYIFLAVGFGAFGCSWMNDSGFWVVSKLGGLTEKETLKSWTVIATVLSVIGLVMTFAASRLLPLV